MSTEQKSEVNILEVCEAALISAEAALKLTEGKLTSSKASLDDFEKSYNKSVKELERSKRDVEDAISAVTNQGEPAPEGLKSKVLNIEAQILQAKKDHENSSQRLEIARAREQAEKDHESATASVAGWAAKIEVAKYLANKFEDGGHPYGASVAPCFKTLDEARSKYLAEIPVVLNVNADGRVGSVSFWEWSEAASCRNVSLGESGSSYFVQEIPNSLRWIKYVKKYAAMRSEDDGDVVQSDGVYLVRVDPAFPKPDAHVEGEADQELQPMVACWDDRLLMHQPSLYKRGYFYVEATGEFYAAWPKDFPDVEVKYHTRASYHGAGIREVSGLGKRGVYDASVLFTDLQTVLWDEEHGLPDALLQRYVQAIKKFASSSTEFEPRKKQLTLDLIEKEIGMYWKAFISSPWSQAIESPTVIMLKHLCERGIESPHIWTREHKGHYGFRVRTRDHSWIVGQIYCPPSSLSRETVIAHEEVIYTPGSSYASLVLVGDAIIYAEGFERDFR
jgi:hypothetical protein